MIDMSQFQLWFLTGSQHLYGPETLKKVQEHSTEIANALGASTEIPVRVVSRPVLTDSESILNTCQAANSTSNCIGVITWMHTFSPAKMWIRGLAQLAKPMAHLHTQYNREHMKSDRTRGWFSYPVESQELLLDGATAMAGSAGTALAGMARPGARRWRASGR